VSGGCIDGVIDDGLEGTGTTAGPSAAVVPCNFPSSNHTLVLEWTTSLVRPIHYNPLVAPPRKLGLGVMFRMSHSKDVLLGQRIGLGSLNMLGCSSAMRCV